jgi:hypothetical protein
MPLLSYPEELPGVSSFSFSPLENVIRDSSSEDPMAFRSKSSNIEGKASVSFKFLENDYNIFLKFCKNDLLNFSKTFILKCPVNGEFKPCWVKFTDKFKATKQSYNNFSVSCEILIRDFSKFSYFFAENFQINDYTLIQGAELTSIVSTIFANSLGISSQDSTESAINRKFVNFGKIDELECKFKMTSVNQDDASILVFRKNNINVFTFNPKREQDVDSAQRAFININGYITNISNSVLSFGVFYKLKVIFGKSPQSSAVYLIDTRNSNLVKKVFTPGNISDLLFDEILFYSDANGQTTPVIWDDVFLKRI